MNRTLPKLLLVIVACVAVVGIAAFALQGAESESPTLQALREDPMATWTPSSVRGEDVSQTDRGTSLGKQRRASILRVLHIDHEQTDLLQTIAKKAKETGWHTKELDNGEFTGYKQLPNTAARLGIYWVDDAHTRVGVLLTEVDTLPAHLED